MADTIMPDCSPVHNPTSIVDLHASWLERLAELEASASETEMLPREYDELSDKLVSTQAQTAAGTAAQVQFYLDDFAPASGAEREMLQNVLATLRKLA